MNRESRDDLDDDVTKVQRDTKRKCFVIIRPVLTVCVIVRHVKLGESSLVEGGSGNWTARATATAALKNVVKCRQNKQCQRSRADQSADHDSSEWLLNFAARPGCEQQWN